MGERHEEEYWKARLVEMIRARLSATLFSAKLPDSRLSQAAHDVASKTLNPYEFAERIVEEFLSEEGLLQNLA